MPIRVSSVLIYLAKIIHFYYFSFTVENFSTFFAFVSSNNPLPTKRKVGRPATGRTTRVIRASVPIWLDDEAKKSAFDTGESYSGFITRAIQSAILQLKSKS